MEISMDGENALLGINSSSENSGSSSSNKDLNFKTSVLEENDKVLDETGQILDIQSSSLCFLDLHALKVTNKFPFWD